MSVDQEPSEPPITSAYLNSSSTASTVRPSLCTIPVCRPGPPVSSGRTGAGQLPATCGCASVGPTGAGDSPRRPASARGGGGVGAREAGVTNPGALRGTGRMSAGEGARPPVSGMAPDWRGAVVGPGAGLSPRDAVGTCERVGAERRLWTGRERAESGRVGVGAGVGKVRIGEEERRRANTGGLACESGRARPGERGRGAAKGGGRVRDGPGGGPRLVRLKPAFGGPPDGVPGRGPLRFR